MKLTKKKLILILRHKLESLGFKYVQDTRPMCQGLFIMKVDNNMFLTLSLDIHRYYDSMFTCSYYLSPIILVGAIWGDIPKDSYTRPGFVLSDEEFAKFSKNENLSARDIWFDGFNEMDVNSFIEIVNLTYKRFSSNINLRERINQSQDVKLLVNLSQDTLEKAMKREFCDELGFQPDKELDGVPFDWFKAAETVIRKHNYFLNKNTVRNLAFDAYVKYCFS